MHLYFLHSKGRKQKKRFQGHSRDVIMNNWKHSTSDWNTFWGTLCFNFSSCGASRPTRQWRYLQADNQSFLKGLPQTLPFYKKEEVWILWGKIVLYSWVQLNSFVTTWCNSSRIFVIIWTPHASHKGPYTRRGMDPLAPDIYSAILSASKHCLNWQICITSDSESH